MSMITGELTPPQSLPHPHWNAYLLGYRFAIIGKRGRVIHRITETGKTACNGTTVQPTDRLFVTFADAQRSLGIVEPDPVTRYNSMTGLCQRETY